MTPQEGTIIILDSQWLHKEELSKEKPPRQLVRVYLAYPAVNDDERNAYPIGE